MEGGIELLKKGFAALEKHVRKRKTALEDRLQREERLDAADNAWLDEQSLVYGGLWMSSKMPPTTSFVTTLGDTYARDLDALLATFGRQTQLDATNAMSDTTITDFFTRAT
ncbi:hypothetical protein DFH09DRAFT_1309022 [Mycena vulgaris]|nr:hypothetical protein DFH09DRAFT_1309022 [Mycena vulgaris]